MRHACTLGAPTLVALARQGVPQVDGCVAVAGAHDGGVAAVQVLHVRAEGHDVLEAGDDHAAGDGGAHELVARHRHGANGLAESHHGGVLLEEGHHHAKQRAIAVDEETLFGEPVVLEDVQHTVQVVHCALHGGADVDVQDGGLVLVGSQVHGQVLIVNLTSLKGLHLRWVPVAGQMGAVLDLALHYASDCKQVPCVWCTAQTQVPCQVGPSLP